MVVCPDEVNPAENGGATKTGCRVLEMRHWVAVGDCSLVQGMKRLQSPGVYLDTMCNGEDQLLEEGWIILSSSMWSNSSLRQGGGYVQTLGGQQS